ncbi:hypothetical protein EJ05DRAFT_471885 [Pseudovirgaria hyperparasitica]|uniref:Galactose oxidase n=1 Tax=Pseudovirgaria hyperparasitica TaxID=470096 RepID=A0A6A6WL44_9PEZI|nr:uncharacterized protein EJ05DRAFT_471885 [Pseudovirgaria hyperparasitica]KAF2762924.1 hypothetical protein EJ05DRAFT_471885 [Pseudovirgaria hyperparasitica]
MGKIYPASSCVRAALLLACLGVREGCAQAGSFAPTAKVCRLVGGRAALFDNRIFMAGSNVTLTEDPAGSYPTDSLLSIDLAQTRDLADTLTNVISTALPAGHQNSSANVKVGGAMWFDRTDMYDLSVARDSDNKLSSQLWRFTPFGEQHSWKQWVVTGEKMPTGDGLGAAYASIRRFNTSFFSGGTFGSSEVGIIELNSTDPADPVISYRKPPADSILGSKRTKAPMFYLPYGNQGILVMLGGVVSLQANGNDLMAAMDSIDIYDIESSRWFNTPATLDLPSTRKNFCGWVTQAPDNSSSFITINGGEDNTESKDDVWVLTIPSFKWVSMNDSRETGRRNHHCFKHGHNNGVVLGGEVINKDDNSVVDCSSPKNKPVLRSLDLSEYYWMDEFDPVDKPFSVHPKLSSTIGSQVFSPDLEPSLKEIFTKRIADEEPPTTPTSPGETQSGQPPDSAQTDPVQTPGGTESPVGPNSTPPSNRNRSLSTSQKAAIGGAVGGSFIVLAILGLACFWFRKRKDHRPDRYMYRSKTSSLTICESEPEKDGFLHVPDNEYSSGYRDAVPATMRKSGHSRINSWSRQVPAHRTSCSVSSVSRLDVPGQRNSFSVSSVSKLDNAEDFYRNGNTGPGGLTPTGQTPMSDISSVMGTIIVCDGESPGINGRIPQAGQRASVREISPFRQPVRDPSPYRPEDVGKTFI